MPCPRGPHSGFQQASAHPHEPMERPRCPGPTRWSPADTPSARRPWRAGARTGPRCPRRTTGPRRGRRRWLPCARRPPGRAARGARRPGAVRRRWESGTVHSALLRCACPLPPPHVGRGQAPPWSIAPRPRGRTPGSAALQCGGRSSFSARVTSAGAARGTGARRAGSHVPRLEGEQRGLGQAASLTRWGRVSPRSTGLPLPLAPFGGFSSERKFRSTARQGGLLPPWAFAHRRERTFCSATKGQPPRSPSRGPHRVASPVPRVPSRREPRLPRVHRAPLRPGVPSRQPRVPLAPSLPPSRCAQPHGHSVPLKASVARSSGLAHRDARRARRPWPCPPTCPSCGGARQPRAGTALRAASSPRPPQRLGGT
jgi:hypothetical protein